MRHAQTRLSIPSSELGLDYPSNPSLLLSDFSLLAANTVAYGPTASPIWYFTHSWAQLDRKETFRFVSAFATLNAFPSWRRRLAETIVELSSVRVHPFPQVFATMATVSLSSVTPGPEKTER
ncbi:hypothetical protein PtB15_14B355 [Puccinia triticina]|nr:hypothetical protein PtB15_14B355 [Puccinia triticina]